jgi:hypothetical protein
MNKYRFSHGALVLVALLVLDPSVTFTQPSRNANIWHWSDHEPVPSEVQKKEQAAGILSTPEQQQVGLNLYGAFGVKRISSCASLILLRLNRARSRAVVRLP